MYVIKNTRTGKYVARPGLKKSYTTAISNMQKFATKEEAERNCCPENERVVDAYSMLLGGC